MSRYERSKELYAETKSEIISSENAYKDFMEFAGKFHRYSTMSQILIYAQRPDATACASMEFWNKNGTYVKRGSKGIALFNYDNGEQKNLRYVFDIADTYAKTGKTPVSVWKYEDGAYADVLMNISNQYFMQTSLTEAIKDIASEYCDSLSRDDFRSDGGKYLSIITGIAMANVKTGAVAGEDENISEHIENLIYSSILYRVYSRLDIPVDFEMDFSALNYFQNENDSDILPFLCEICQPCTRRMLDCIRDGVLQYRKRTEIKERSERDETGISRRGGISDPESDRQQRNSEAGQMGQSKEAIPAGTRSGTVSGHENERNAEHAPFGHRRTSRGDVGKSDRENEEGRRSDRTAQRRGSDALGRTDEQYSDKSRADGNGGSDLRIEKSIEKSEGESLPFFDEKLQKEILSASSYFDDEFIRDLYKTGQLDSESLSFFAPSNAEHIEIDGRVIEVESAFSELEVVTGITLKMQDEVMNLSWEDVASLYTDIIENRTVLSETEKKRNELSYYTEGLDLVIENADLDCGRDEVVKTFNGSSFFTFAEFVKKIFPKGYKYIETEDESFGFRAGEDFLIVWNNEYPERTKEARILWGDVASRFSELIVSGIYKAPVEPFEEFNTQLEAENDNSSTEIGVKDIVSGKYDFLFYDKRKLDIYHAFKDVNSLTEKTEILKKSFGTGGQSIDLEGYGRGFANYDAKDISLSFYDKDIKDIRFKWPEIAKEVSSGIEAETFLDEKLKKEYEESYLPQLLQRQRRSALSERIKECAREYNALLESFAENGDEKEQYKHLNLYVLSGYTSLLISGEFGSWNHLIGKCPDPDKAYSIFPPLLQTLEHIMNCPEVKERELFRKCSALYNEIQAEESALSESAYKKADIKEIETDEEIDFDDLKPADIPYVICAFTENKVIEANRRYSVPEFNKIVAAEEKRMHDGREALCKEFGSLEAAHGAGHYEFTGYDKTDIYIVMPDGTVFHDRLDIGDGYRDFFDYLSRMPEAAEIYERLKRLFLTEKDVFEADIPKPIEVENSKKEDAEETQNEVRKSAFVRCLASETDNITEGIEYPLDDFDELVRTEDHAQVYFWEQTVEKYGSFEEAIKNESEVPVYKFVRFEIVLPDGNVYELSRNLGDGFGGIFDGIIKLQEECDIENILAYSMRTISVKDIDSAAPPKEVFKALQDWYEFGKNTSFYNAPKGYETDAEVYRMVKSLHAYFIGDENESEEETNSRIDEFVNAVCNHYSSEEDKETAKRLLAPIESAYKKEILSEEEKNRLRISNFTMDLVLLFKRHAADFDELDKAAYSVISKFTSAAEIREYISDIKNLKTLEASLIELSKHLKEDFLKLLQDTVSLCHDLPEWKEDAAKQISPKDVEIIPPPQFSGKKPEFNNYGGNKTDFSLLGFNNETVGKKERFQRNCNAISLVKKLKEENRYANEAEQNALALYAGWGGIPEAFDKENTSWQNEYEQLKSLLSDEEYASARESTLTAFYTPQTIAMVIYGILSRIGLKDGNVLEPSCGIGNFIGCCPQETGLNFYGVEIDGMSADIAGQLYQNAKVLHSPFEKADLPDNFFDAAIGNVPFGDFKLSDRKYDRYNFLIHDYFFAKTLDKVRAGGVVAFITSKGTLDKKDERFRRYLAERADLLGAIRLPGSVFSGNAGTDVTSDIIILQKRESFCQTMPSWVETATDSDGITMNRYFVDNPGQIAGKMITRSGRFGLETVCVQSDGEDFESALKRAADAINGTYTPAEVITADDENILGSIPADPDVRNFSYTIFNDKLYFRENSYMVEVDEKGVKFDRIKGMIAIRDLARELIDLQLYAHPDDEINDCMQRLNEAYDGYTSKYGLINDPANKRSFSKDSSFPLLTSLEKIDEDGNLEEKADIFFKKTIRPQQTSFKADNADEAYAISISEKARIDIDFMSSISGFSEEELFSQLKGMMFQNPEYKEKGGDKYIPQDEYLSGNVKEKLATAKIAAEADPAYRANVDALQQVQPEPLSAAEISVRIGATWIPVEYYNQFMKELFMLSYYEASAHQIEFVSLNGGAYMVNHSRATSYSDVINSTYGTDRVNAYQLLELALNLKEPKVFDIITDAGKERRVLNRQATAIAQSKQDQIKNAFNNWIFEDSKRRQRLEDIYNDLFNSTRLREYDGSHIRFDGMNPEIRLKEHQVNAVARILYGGNTLLAHEVGAGKTFEMISAAQESKRLGMCNKSLFVVPKHLVEQWGAEYMRLYPAANVLITTPSDFTKQKRKQFCARIATGDFDAIIMSQSQFEKIPLSKERQADMLQMQLDSILNGIKECKNSRGNRLTIKQLEKSRKRIEAKLEKLTNDSGKDDVVTFEELGIDRLFIDESQYYKNLYIYTKMSNVGGIAQTEAMKSSDLFMKCRYIDEITGNKGVIFATGTPISNSMVEMYTIQRYLQFDRLEETGLADFDSWASTFGEAISAMELTPEGQGYRLKTRFAKFFNLPELMNIFKDVADIKTGDMLNLPVPNAIYKNISAKPSEHQKSMLDGLVKRAEKVRDGLVDPSADNMLKITNDGRKLALDQRLMNPGLADFEGSKVNMCVENVYEIYNDTSADKLTQLIFSDLSTPKAKDEFDVYNDIKDKLIDLGVAEKEIAFIHDYETPEKKKSLFRKVNAGDVRILLGSTSKLGAGSNVQNKLIAIHNIDCPWRPSDLQQRAGRIIRQGNSNDDVYIYRYVTEGTFDAYLYQLIETKQRFASQIMTSKTPIRVAEDVDEVTLSYAEMKMLASGNPLIKEKMDLDIQVQKLSMLKTSYQKELYSLQRKVTSTYPEEIRRQKKTIEDIKADIETVNAHKADLSEESSENSKDETPFAGMMVNGVLYDSRKEASEAMMAVCKTVKDDTVPVGSYRGFSLEVSWDHFDGSYSMCIMGAKRHYIALSDSASGNLRRIDNFLEKLPELLSVAQEKLEIATKNLEFGKIELERKAFPQEKELREKSARLAEVNALLENSDIEEQTQLDIESSEKENAADISADEDGAFDKVARLGTDRVSVVVRSDDETNTKVHECASCYTGGKSVDR